MRSQPRAIDRARRSVEAVSLLEHDVEAVHAVLAAVSQRVARLRWALGVDGLEQVAASAALDAVDDLVRLHISTVGAESTRRQTVEETKESAMSDQSQLPEAWIGHVAITSQDISGSVGFYEALGLRTVMVQDTIAIFELRGGTHLIVQPADAGGVTGGEAPFDLMVEDIEESRRRWIEQGITVSEVSRGGIHDSFTATDPGGWTIAVRSSHVVGPV